MPVTPLHMGPGLMIKALLQGSFSLMVFGWAQIVMDIQPLIALSTGHGTLHGLTHTLIGATLLAIFAALSGKYLGEYGLRLIGMTAAGSPLRISWMVAIVSALSGTWSHLLLDAIMHADVVPFALFTSTNSLHGLLSIETIEILCLLSGGIGALLYLPLNRWLAAKVTPEK